ncbi:MAG TPA: hypothetical protein VGC31_07170 [Paenirhodobacter sp.]
MTVGKSCATGLSGDALFRADEHLRRSGHRGNAELSSGGLILVSSSLSSGLAQECQKIGLPVVQVNRVSGRGTVSSIVCDNRGGAAQIADFLVAGGHAQIAFMAGLEAASTNHDREGGFIDRLALLGSARIG